MSKQPNILYIMADQWRHDWTGYLGASWLKTPNIDRLAAKATVFTQATTTSPVCAPARIGLATGLYPERLGALDNHRCLPPYITTWYQAFRDAGYRVGSSGKLDLAKPQSDNSATGDRPAAYRFGFTHPIEVEGKMHAGRYDDPQGPYGHWLAERRLYQTFRDDYREREAASWDNGLIRPSPLPADAFADTYIADRACEQIAAYDDLPWYQFVSFVGPHNPFDPPFDVYQDYRDIDVPPAVPQDRMEGKPRKVQKAAGTFDDAHIAEARRLYSASIDVIDRGVGKILETLEARGDADNTIIIFTSDHGEMLGDFGRFTKSVPYEGSVRIPMLISLPGQTEGQTTEALAELHDTHSTLGALAGVHLPHKEDGRSLLPILEDPSAKVRDLALATHRGFCLARTATEKYVINDADSDEYYDLAADPQELENRCDPKDAEQGRLREAIIDSRKLYR